MEIQKAAAILYAARKNRDLHPQGTFDNAGRFYPDNVEDSDGYTCGLRSPSRSWPYSYMTAARTRKHAVGLALSAPAFVLAEAAKASGTTVPHKSVAAMKRAIDKLRREHAAEEAERALLVRRRQDEAAAEARRREEVEADAQHAADMEIDAEFLMSISDTPSTTEARR